MLGVAGLLQQSHRVFVILRRNQLEIATLAERSRPPAGFASHLALFDVRAKTACIILYSVFLQPFSLCLATNREKWFDFQGNLQE